uniref:Uncharacterized protein LOC114341726 n=1 Tax=Diabrotica virgifera virgifera TaxID=50390 RepID=A0A6P7GSR2_DIAVI
MLENHPCDKPTTKSQYRNIFNTEFNIGFFSPKKDMCLTCNLYNTKAEKDQIGKEYALYIANKCVAREAKNRDKEVSKKTETVVTPCFDLQKILTTLQSEVSLFYYKRKFKVYNFTIFDLGSAEGYCYAWDETTGKKGPNEISSALFDFIKRKFAGGALEFTSLFRLLWGTKSKSNNILMYIYAAKFININITHTFFEVGHSQSEGNSMHTLIMRRKKNQVVYVRQQWYTLIRCAKVTGKPYDLKELSQNDILDFKSMLKKMPNWDLDIDKRQ